MILPRLPSLMSAPEFESGVDTPPLAIEHSSAVLNEIRLAAVDGLNRLPHGGVEIGGVLFGTHNGHAVHIAAHRPLTCEYASGPTFTLSENDRRELERLLTKASSHPDLAGLEPVGWYHSHTRSGIHLSEQDLNIFHRYFPHPWQVALVVRPANLDPTRAGFFFREADGSVHAASSHKEFTIAPLAHLGKAPARPVPATSAAPISRAVREAKQEAATPRTMGRSRWKEVAVVALLLVSGYLALHAYTARVAAGDLSLRATDVGRHLRVEWNRGADAVLRAMGGAIDIEDGGAKRHIEMELMELRAGSITYARKSGNVLVRLTLRLPAGRTMVELTRFLGAAGEQ